MWLNLEAGVARSLSRHPGVNVMAPPSPDHRWYGRRALVVEAAHTLFHEAAVDSLPEQARAEVEAGWGGPIRSRIAQLEADDPELPGWRDQLVALLGGSADVDGALNLVDRVYAGRQVDRQVPPVVTAGCISWYGYWRSTNGGPSLREAESMQTAGTAWVDHPTDRSTIDATIDHLARQLAGDNPRALTDVNV